MPTYPKDGRNYKTEDLTTWITKIVQGPPLRISYENSDGDAWWIEGDCNACGACELNGDGSMRAGVVPVTGKVIGEPSAVFEAAYEVRMDIPVRPNLTWAMKAKGCVLTGEYTRTTKHTPPDTR